MQFKSEQWRKACIVSDSQKIDDYSHSYENRPFRGQWSKNSCGALMRWLNVEMLNAKNWGKISAQPHTTLCIQFLNREKNDKNNTLPLRKHICLTIVWGCAEILPKLEVVNFCLTSWGCDSNIFLSYSIVGLVDLSLWKISYYGKLIWLQFEATAANFKFSVHFSVVFLSGSVSVQLSTFPSFLSQPVF